VPFDSSYHVYVAQVLLWTDVFPDASDHAKRVPRAIDNDVVADTELSANRHLVELAGELIGVPRILPGAMKAGRNAVDGACTASGRSSGSCHFGGRR
jgi:hypothetical protein